MNIITFIGITIVSLIIVEETVILGLKRFFNGPFKWESKINEVYQTRKKKKEWDKAS